jgi:hypothetical protein
MKRLTEMLDGGIWRCTIWTGRCVELRVPVPSRMSIARHPRKWMTHALLFKMNSMAQAFARATEIYT